METKQTSQSWNMGNSEFRNLGTISRNTTINGLTFIASTDRTMNVRTANTTVNGVQYSHALALEGSGSTNNRAVSIRATGASTLRIIARSNGNDTRTLLVTNIHGHILNRILCTSTAAAHTITFRGDQNIYIYSTDSNILIHEIQLITSPSSSSTKAWNMSTERFRNLGRITRATTIDGLHLFATSDRSMRVDSANVTVNSVQYSHALFLEGSGSVTFRSVALNLTGTSTIQVVARSTGSESRNLQVVGQSGRVYGTLSFSSTASTRNINIQADETIYLFSAHSNINIHQVHLTTTGAIPGADEDDVSDGTVVRTYAQLVETARTMANSGGIIYIDARRLIGTERLNLNNASNSRISIIGRRQSDGTFPIIDYTPFRNEKVGATGQSLVASGDDGVGFRITGTNYTIRNLIIEKAPDNGIQIKGQNANHNTVENCILRYNNDTGLQISDGASHNTIRFVYSYRNCDVFTRGGNADGFAPKLAAVTGNRFIGCYAWENSDDGWDSFDKSTTEATQDVLYDNCACWSNGYADIYTGKRDFDNNLPLDQNLFLVELMVRQSPSFVTNYNNRNFTLPTGNFIRTDAGTLSASNWVNRFDGNSNGFKLGSSFSTARLTRDLRNCLSFDHGDKGFDNNNGACTASFQNTVAFDNSRNYYIPLLTISRWTNVVGFSGRSNDGIPGNRTATVPSSSMQSTIRQRVNSTVQTIVNLCNSNVIPGEIYFDIY